VTVRAGSPGQFDVVADGEVVASKQGGFLNALLGRGWPTPAAVLAALRVLQSTPNRTP
jgi:hypothetical protein